MTAKEIWREVPSVPEVMASSWGRIMKKPYSIAMPNGGIREYRSRPTYGFITRAHKGAAHSYRGVYFRHTGNLKVHRVVCEAFHGEAPTGCNVVIHKDEDAHNNRPENLRWGTQKENLNSPGFIAFCRSRTGEASPVVKGRSS